MVACFVWALVAFYFSNITFQINLILSVFDCLFSVVFFEVIGFRWFSKGSTLEIPHTSWTMVDICIQVTSNLNLPHPVITLSELQNAA